MQVVEGRRNRLKEKTRIHVGPTAQHQPDRFDPFARREWKWRHRPHPRKSAPEKPKQLILGGLILHLFDSLLYEGTSAEPLAHFLIPRTSPDSLQQKREGLCARLEIAGSFVLLDRP
jgi:hypothetical protein